MTHDPTAPPKAVKPVILVGFVAVALATLGEIQPDDSVIWVEEPDIIRERQARDQVVQSPVVRELVEWEHYLPGKADEFYNLYQSLEPAAVIPLTEYATPFAARLAERYGLPGAGFGAAQILRDKSQLRRVTRAAGIHNPESALVESAADVLGFMQKHPGPVVLRPANRQGPVGVRVIHDRSEVEQAWADIVVQDEGMFGPDRPPAPHMLAERFVSGAEYSVETLVRDGRELFVDVTGKRLFPGPRPAEPAHVVPADTTPELAELLGEQTRRVIEAIGFLDGIVHCEWIVADGVPHLVECAGWFAGDGIVELFERAYPVELVNVYYSVMKGEPLPELPRAAKGGAAVRFLSIQPGAVADVCGVETARSTDGCAARRTAQLARTAP